MTLGFSALWGWCQRGEKQEGQSLQDCPSSAFSPSLSTVVTVLFQADSIEPAFRLSGFAPPAGRASTIHLPDTILSMESHLVPPETDSDGPV